MKWIHRSTRVQWLATQKYLMHNSALEIVENHWSNIINNSKYFSHEIKNFLFKLQQDVKVSPSKASGANPIRLLKWISHSIKTFPYDACFIRERLWEHSTHIQAINIARSFFTKRILRQKHFTIVLTSQEVGGRTAKSSQRKQQQPLNKVSTRYMSTEMFLCLVPCDGFEAGAGGWGRRVKLW